MDVKSIHHEVIKRPERFGEMPLPRLAKIGTWMQPRPAGRIRNSLPRGFCYHPPMKPGYWFRRDWGWFCHLCCTLVAAFAAAQAIASVDADGDGMLDDWEVAYFGSTNATRGSAAADFDGDGLSNLAEFRTGTNPTNTLSRLRLTQIERLPNSRFAFTWPGATGCVYNLEAKFGPAAPFTNVLATNVPAAFPQTVCTVSVQNASQAFFRLRWRPMFVGAANTATPGMTYQQSWAALDAAVGPLSVRRSYSSGLVTNFPTTVAAIDVGKRVSVFSFKTSWSEMAAGQHDADVRNLVTSIPANHLTYLCWFHEPENDGTAAAFVPAFRQFATVAKAVGRSNVKVTLILMTWTWNTASGRNPSDWWPGAEYVDAVGLDGYNSYNGTNKTTWKALSDVFQTPTDWLRAHGAREIGVAECGCRERIGDANAKANWLRDGVKWADSQRFSFFCYFDSDVGSAGEPPWWLRTSTQATQAYRDLAAAHR